MHEHKTISEVRWLISMGDGSPVLLCDYGDQSITVYGKQKPALLELDLVTVQGLDPEQYDTGEVELRGHQGSFEYTSANQLVESAQLTLEVMKMNDAFMSSPNPLSDDRFAR